MSIRLVPTGQSIFRVMRLYEIKIRRAAPSASLLYLAITLSFQSIFTDSIHLSIFRSSSPSLAFQPTPNLPISPIFTKMRFATFFAAFVAMFLSVAALPMPAAGAGSDLTGAFGNTLGSITGNLNGNTGNGNGMAQHMKNLDAGLSNTILPGNAAGNGNGNGSGSGNSAGVSLPRFDASQIIPLTSAEWLRLRQRGWQRQRSWKRQRGRQRQR